MTSPLDSFLEYLKEAKPYHTKILEVIESYTFREEMDVSFAEKMTKTIGITSEVLCKQTGFGLDYDDNCGYDAIDCCDLFECNGGYGLIFDNSDLVASDLIVSLNDNEGWLEVQGNKTIDTRFEVIDVPDSTTLVVSGDATPLLTDHKIFLFVNLLPFSVVSNDSSTLRLSGNHVDFIKSKKEFSIEGTETAYNGKYVVKSVLYEVLSDETVIEFVSFKPIASGDLQGLPIMFRNSNPNVGMYQVNNFSFDGVNTSITITNGNMKLANPFLTEYQKGSIQFRTAYKYSRQIEVDLSAGSRSHHILYSEYIPTTNTTKVYVDGDIGDYTPGTDFVNMYGYIVNSGFDADPECLLPKENHIYTMVEEQLNIKVTDLSLLNMKPAPEDDGSTSMLNMLGE